MHCVWTLVGLIGLIIQLKVKLITVNWLNFVITCILIWAHLVDATMEILKMQKQTIYSSTHIILVFLITIDI